MKTEKTRTTALTLCAGLLIGSLLVGSSAANAVEAYLKAYPSSHAVYLDGQKIDLEAYVINGSNYVQLRDIGEAVGFNVYWDNENHCVQVESDKPYTGQPSLPSTDLDAVRAEMVERINAVRMQNGVQFLRIDDRLMAAAQACADQRLLYHNNQAECEAVARSGYPYGFGSNLCIMTGASGADTPQRAVTSWVNSPGHYKTMVDPACDSMGVGIAESDGITYCYLFVGKPGTINPYG